MTTKEEEHLRRASRAAQRRAEVLVELAKDMRADDGGLVPSLRRITEVAASTLDVDRVGVWRFDEPRVEIRGIEVFERAPAHHTSSPPLSKSRYPAYFRALELERTIAAVDAREDPRTREFRDDYLAPLGIVSMLDAPVRVGGELAGVICHEARGVPRRWTHDEQTFAGSMSDFVALAFETHDLRRTEAELRDRELRLDQAIAGSQGGEWELRAIAGRDLLDSGWCRLSPRLKAFIGFAPHEFPDSWTAWSELVHPADRARVAAAAQAHVEGHSPHYEVLYRIRHRDGTWRHVHSRGCITRGEGGEPVRWSGISWDVTELQRAEREQALLESRLRDTQKLESLGVLASGIAHDFNNLLGAVLGNAGLALSDMPDGSPGRPFVQQIERAALRAAELTGQLLAYSGRGQFAVENIELNALVEEMIQLVEVSVSKKAELRFSLHESLPTVVGDPTQLRQLIMNLVTNASDALEGEPGVISVSTGVAAIDRRALREVYGNEELPEGEYACIEIADTGCGMDPAAVERIFEPFYSTKETGRGLGLATVAGTVRNLRGAVRVFSEPDVGTTIRLLLPAADPLELVPTSATETGAAESSGASGGGGRGTVLVADDDESVRAVTAIALERAGYRVLQAGDGRDAVECFRNHADEIDLAVLDLTMPRLDGEEVLREIRSLKPSARVILASGYGEPARDREASAFLAKPFHPDQLIELVGKTIV